MMILLGIFGRLLDFQVRGSDAYAGYLMAGSGFLALAHTLKRGEHIRVSVVSRLLEGHAHKLLELIAIGIAVLLAIVLAWFSVGLALERVESRAAGDAMALTIWGTTSSWTLTALPLFVWMGEILFHTRLSEDMFRGLAPWLERVPGRLLHTNIIGCTIFAAVSIS